MGYLFRHAICNEVFEQRTLSEACRVARGAGYGGIEIAPFTLAEDPAVIAPAARREYRDAMESEGIAFVGLHWLMVSPPGLHLTAPDPTVRTRSWFHVHRLIDLCADLGEGGVMVFGSPKQRGSTGGMSVAEATRYFVECFAAAAGHAGTRGVTLLLEALPPAQCDVVTSLEETAAIVRQIDHPAVRTMFDTHNAVAEMEPHAALIERNFDLIRHVHLNEMDGRHPGTGSYDFKPVLEVLGRRGYGGWLSLEVFDFSAGGEAIAGDSRRFLESEIARLDA